MKKVCIRSMLFAFVLCLAILLQAEGFVADTLVRTSHGAIPIQELAVGDEVSICTFKNHLASAPIANVVSHDVDSFIRLEIDDDTIDLAHDQLLFVPLQLQWLAASDIQPGMYLLGAPLRAVRVQSVTKIEQKTQLYALSLNQHHNYLVGKQKVVAHNFSECALIAMPAAEGVTFLNAFLLANPLVAPVTIGVGGAGLVGYLVWTFVSEIKESRKAKRDKGKNADGGGTNGPGSDNNNNGHGAIGSSIVFLKSLDDNKQNAAEAFRRSYEWLTTTPGGLQAIEHSFRENCRHNFVPLLHRMGTCITDKKGVVRVGTKILADLTQKLIDMGSTLPIDYRNIFEKVVLEYGGELITVQGFVHDGVIKISTMFIQPKHVR